MRKLSRRILFKRLAIFVALASAILVTFLPASTTFDVNAETESLHVWTGPAYSLIWALADTDIYRDFETHAEVFTGVFTPSEGTDIAFERVGFGPLRIRCKRSVGSVGTLLGQDGQRELGQRASFVISATDKQSKSERSIRLPLAGKIELGQDLTFDSTTSIAILQKGNVRVLGRSLISPTLFEAGTYPLELGDDLTISAPKSPSVGLLVMDVRPGLQVSFRGVGESALVNRFASRGYQIRTSIYTRLKNDSALQVLWLSSIAFVGIARSFWKEERA